MSGEQVSVGQSGMQTQLSSAKMCDTGRIVSSGEFGEALAN